MVIPKARPSMKTCDVCGLDYQASIRLYFVDGVKKCEHDNVKLGYLSSPDWRQAQRTAEMAMRMEKELN